MVGGLHCSVHVVRKTVDERSLSICYHDPSFELDPLKPLINGLFLVRGGDLGNKGYAVRQSKRFFASNVGISSRKTKLRRALDAC